MEEAGIELNSCLQTIHGYIFYFLIGRQNFQYIFTNFHIIHGVNMCILYITTLHSRCKIHTR